MDFATINRLLEKYELENPVDNWELHGIKVWPIIRLLFINNPLGAANNPGWKLEQSSDPTGRGFFLTHYAGALRRLKAGLQQESQANRELRKRDIPNAEVIILTHSDRMLWNGSQYYNTIVDPWIERFASEGIATAVLTTGKPKENAQFAHFRLQERFELISIIANYRTRLYLTANPRVPQWYREFQDYQIREIGGAISWKKLVDKVFRVKGFSEYFTKLVRSSKAKLFMIDTWYSPYGLAAILSARRAGIESIDLQHGVQDYSHLAYSYWHKKSDGKNSVQPDRYWLWGDRNAAERLENNRDFLKPEMLFVGGNLWINKWRNPDGDFFSDAFKTLDDLRAGTERLIVVTLQTNVPFKEQLAELIRLSPPGWMWMLRPHRSQKESHEEIEKAFKGITTHRVNVADAASLPLYCLLQRADLHMTWYSTCAQEAIAFKTPSVLLSERGKICYLDYVESGLMSELERPEDFVPMCNRLFEIDWRQHQQEIDSSFVDPARSDSEIARLIKLIRPL